MAGQAPLTSCTQGTRPCLAPGLGSWTLDPGSWTLILDSGLWIWTRDLDSGILDLDSGSGLWILGFWILDSDPGLWILGFWILDSGFWYREL